MGDLPEKFLERMQLLLGEEYEAFLRCFDGQRQYGLRVNTAKITPEEFEKIVPFHLKKIPWVSEGYFYDREDAPARHPFYAAGLYYLQEPSAMTPASRLRTRPGEKVLDLCAAPGGKATALGAGLRGEGLLVANDINTARGRALLRNLELFGISNSLVANEPPHILAEKFPEYFDKIMVDAPCSGEGMFRKNPAVAESWKEKGPDYFSALQKEIVLHAADMLKPGGQMFYSTCTFAPEENERIMTHLLENRPEMELIPMEEWEGFSEGITEFQGEHFHESCRLCRRIWPHHMAGEGHFLALLQKKAGTAKEPLEEVGSVSFGISGKPKKRKKQSGQQPPKGKPWWAQVKGLTAEQRKALEEFFVHISLPIDAARIDVRGEKLYYVPDASLSEMRLHFHRNGVYLGDLKKKRFEPAQPFALILSPDTCDRVIRLAQGDERTESYLRGESFPVTKEDGVQGSGWYLVTVEGYPLGFGKAAGAVLKNKYPAGWRKT